METTRFVLYLQLIISNSEFQNFQKSTEIKFTLSDTLIGDGIRVGESNVPGSRPVNYYAIEKTTTDL